MNREETLAYKRGYSAALHGKWPADKPPKPPDELCAKIIDALRAIRNQCDDLIATTSPDDGYEEMFGKYIDAADEALEELGFWLLSCEEEQTKE